MSSRPQRAVARVDVGAIERNCATIRSHLSESTEFCAVVKADGYGHGVAASASAAMRGGAGRLAVVSAAEAEELRGQLPEAPLLVMGALIGDDLDRALAVGAEIGVWREGVAIAASRIAAGLGRAARVHVKHDSGMGRLGERDPSSVIDLCRRVAEDPHLELAGVWTHFATADEPDDAYMRRQLDAFSGVAAAVREIEPSVTVHAANSAATLRSPESHFDMVRCGIAIYGLSPFGEDPSAVGLEPAMTLASTVAAVKRLRRGDSAGYGRRWAAPCDTWLGVLPIGYGDGVRRGLSNNGEALIGGRRHPVVGTVSMDNVTVDLGPETEVSVDDEAILIGRQGDERILAEEVAKRLGTINYEVTCGIASRVPREHGP